MKTTTEKPKAEGDCSPATCSPLIYQVIRNNIEGMDEDTEMGKWGIELLQGILDLSPKENV